MSAMNERKRLDVEFIENERKFQADLHGAKYTVTNRSDADNKPVANFTKEQDDKATRHMEQRIAEMKQRALDKKQQQGS